jgi:peptidoglycan hydrolase-like protein with peptidoglycan-binding domain
VRFFATIGTASMVALIGAGCAATTAGTRGAAAPQAAIPLRLVSISPAPGASGVNGASPVTVTYNQPLPAGVPFPSLSPAVPGAWSRQGQTAVFTPASGYPEKTRVTLRVTAPARTVATFTTGAYSTLRLQQVLAQLGYLPMSWKLGLETQTLGKNGAKARGAGAPAASARTTGETIPATGARAQAWAAYAAPVGTFRWTGGYPSQLRSFWTPGSPNTLTQGAVTAFEADHGLPTDGKAGTAVWKALLKAVSARQVNTHGYSYAVASQKVPETLTIWHNGKQVFRNLTNTGIGVAPTPAGTFPVYEKLPFQIMSGTNPNGSHYADPVKWVSYFSGGSAVHYFDRYTYGFPQSLGCVELPLSAAQQAYPLLPYGTLVTVTPG